MHECCIFAPAADKLLPRRSLTCHIGRRTPQMEHRSSSIADNAAGPGKIDLVADSGKLKWFSVLDGWWNGSHLYTLPCLGVTPCWPMALIRPQRAERTRHLPAHGVQEERAQAAGSRHQAFSQILCRIGALLRPARR